MAGLLDRPEDFERWYASLQANRPVSHPIQLNRDEMYQRWLAEQMRRSGGLSLERAQMPSALAELSALSPTMPATSLALQDPATLRMPPRPARPPLAGALGDRLRGPGSANLIDRRAEFGLPNVVNWLRGYDEPDL